MLLHFLFAISKCVFVLQNHILTSSHLINIQDPNPSSNQDNQVNQVNKNPTQIVSNLAVGHKLSEGKQNYAQSGND